MPGIVVIIDNYFALSETYENIDEQVILLAREGLNTVYLSATATNASLVRYKLSVNFKMAVCFQLTEKSEYDNSGMTEGLEPSKFPKRFVSKSQWNSGIFTGV